MLHQKTQWMLHQVNMNSKMVDSLRSIKLPTNIEVNTEQMSQKDQFQKVDNFNLPSYYRTDVTKTTSMLELPNHMTFEQQSNMSFQSKQIYDMQMLQLKQQNDQLKAQVELLLRERELFALTQA